MNRRLLRATAVFAALCRSVIDSTCHMEKTLQEIARLFAAKEKRRRQLAALPFPHKVRLVVQLQQMAAPILRARGRSIRVWHVDTAPP